MLDAVLVPPSKGIYDAPPPPTTPQEKEEMRPSEAIKLKEAFEDIILHDPRCVGYAKYITDIRIFWSYEIPTACAGDGFIFFNPDFYDSIPEQTRITVCVHEIWHLILKHLQRGKNHDPYIYNKAADHVINNGLESDGFTFEGTDPCKDPKYRNQSTEQVYNAIYKEEAAKPKRDPSLLDGHIPAELIEELIEKVVTSEGKTLEDQKTKAKKDIEKHEDSAGKMTGSQGIRLELSNTKVMIQDATYHDIFAKYLTDPLGGGKRTFMRPNRRQHGMQNFDLRLPGRNPKRGHINRLIHLTYALDVSGSINAKQKQQFHDSVRTIKELLNPSMLTVLFFDTRIVLEKTFSDKEKYGDITVTAGGGTNLTDVWKRTKELDSDALVIFTDLCVSIPPQPDWDCIWLVPKSTNQIPHNIYGEVYLIPEIK